MIIDDKKKLDELSSKVKEDPRLRQNMNLRNIQRICHSEY